MNRGLERVFKTQSKQVRGRAQDARQVLCLERPAEPVVYNRSRRHERMFAGKSVRTGTSVGAVASELVAKPVEIQDGDIV
jgi:hypothetical protein